MPIRDSASPALVLLHFFGNSQREWRRLLPRLSAKYRCLLLDLPGFGASASLGAKPVGAMADFVDGQIREAGITSCVLVGHSMTGKVATVLAARRPDYLAGLLLITPSPPSPEPFSDKVRKQLLAYDGSRQAAADYVDGITVRTLADEWREPAIEDAMHASLDAWKAWIRDGSQEDWADRVGEIDLPAKVIAGMGDPSLNESIQKKMTMPHLPKAALAVIEGGHVLPLENPDALGDEIESFMREF